MSLLYEIWALKNTVKHDAFYMVRGAGIEPARLIQARHFKCLSATNYDTRACEGTLYKFGGTYGSRTHFRAFAELCVTVPPTRHVNQIQEVLYLFSELFATF